MILRGPFTLKWGLITLEDIETIDIDYDVKSEDYEANSGIIYEINRGKKITAKLKFLATDIASIAAVLPQYLVGQNQVMADGAYVFDSRGAIDIVADDCDTEPVYNDLEIISCGNPSESVKILHARTILDDIDIGKIRKIVVKFIGEPVAGSSILQLLGDQGEDNFFQLGNDELFLLGDGENLIL